MSGGGAAHDVRLLVLDVDGVLTDGTFVLTPDGDELKMFHARDGLGLALLQNAGVDVALLTGRRSRAVERRAAELGLARVVQGQSDKLAGIDALLGEFGVEDRRLAYMGDDLTDLPALRRAGFAAAPADAPAEVRAVADFVADHPGGRGAVRDLCEHLLRRMGRWEDVLARFR